MPWAKRAAVILAASALAALGPSKAQAEEAAAEEPPPPEQPDAAGEEQPEEPERPPALPTVLRFGSVELRPDFKLYADWQMDVASDDHANAFHITRAYLGMRVAVTAWLGGRVTFDVSQARDLGASGSAPVEEGEAEVGESGLQGSELARLKYAYLDLGVPRLSLSIRFGVIQTPWIDWMEHIEDSRFLRKILLEEAYHYPSADFGAALVGHVGDWVAYFLGIYNGEGYHGVEDSQFKDVIGRISFRPAPRFRWLSGLQVSGYVQAELPPPQPETEETHRRYGGALTYRLGEEVTSPDCAHVRDELLAVWVQAFYGEEGPADALVGSFGLSAGARVELPYGFFLLGRLDRFDPDLDQGDDLVWTVLAAAGYRPAPGVIIALDYQGVLASEEDDQHLIGVHTELHL